MSQLSSLETRIRTILTETNVAKTRRTHLPAVGVAFGLLFAGIIGCTAVHTPRSNGLALLPGAGTPSKPINGEELEKLLQLKPITAKKFLITFRTVNAKGDTLKVADGSAAAMEGSVTVRAGQTAKIEFTKEFSYPTDFDFPKLGAVNSGSFPVTPTTPLVFETTNLGYEIDELTARPRGGFIMISGTVRETIFDGFVQNVGEIFSPITASAKTVLGADTEVILTENKVLSPSFSVRETPFTAATLPGKSYRLRVNLKSQVAFLELSCQPQ